MKSEQSARIMSTSVEEICFPLDRPSHSEYTRGVRTIGHIRMKVHTIMALAESEKNSLHGRALILQSALQLFSGRGYDGTDRKSTRLNSSHQIISYAVFCL